MNTTPQPKEYTPCLVEKLRSTAYAVTSALGMVSDLRKRLYSGVQEDVRLPEGEDVYTYLTQLNDLAFRLERDVRELREFIFGKD